MVEQYPNSLDKLADIYYLKDGVAVKKLDVLVLTGTVVNGREDVDVMSSSYSPNDVVGLSLNELSATYVDRAITIGVNGMANVKLRKRSIAMEFS